MLILDSEYYQRITSGAVGGDASASLSWQELSDDRVGRGSDGSPNSITDGLIQVLDSPLGLTKVVVGDTPVVVGLFCCS